MDWGIMKTLLVLFILVTFANAQEQDNSPYSATISLGGLFTTGNTELSQIDTELEVSRVLDGPELTATILASASYGKQSEQIYREKYLTLLNIRYEFTERMYSSIDGRWFSNEFIGISDEYRASAGVGWRILRGGILELSSEAGAGYYHRKNIADDVLETSLGYSALMADLTLSHSWSISETAYILADLNEFDNYYLVSDLEAASSITDNLSFVMGYNLIHFTVPPVPGLKETDTALRLQLRFDL